MEELIEMTNEYENAIGIMTHKIGAIEHKIKPLEGDNLRIARIMKAASKNGIDWLYEQFNALYFDMVVRDKPMSEEQKKSFRLWIELNQVQIQKVILVMFGWQTKEQQDKLENMDGDDLKKLINA